MALLVGCEPQLETAPEGPADAAVDPACAAGPTEGCTCGDDQVPVTCYLPPVRDGSGLLCERGTRMCRGGRWGACETLHRYRVGAQQQALISDPAACNPCNPDCYATDDRPTNADLNPTNSDGVEYNPEVGGLVITGGTPRRRGEGLAVCGDSVVEDLEECDDGNPFDGDGCTSLCLREEGFACGDPGDACYRTTCGDGITEGDEECDDGNIQIGDGCTYFCDIEPTCVDGVCTPVCGDGQVFPGEECDDGDTQDGDGCSSSCEVEDGFVCELISEDPPESIDIPVVFRDFQASHPDFQDWCCGNDTGMVEDTLGPDGKPVPIINESRNPSLSTAANFYEWYNDAPSNITVPIPLTVERQADGTYVFDEGGFWVLDGNGWEPLGEARRDDCGGTPHNFYFTSELRFWFEYERGQTLTFRGDDDVWVFFNGQLGVDIGGVHAAVARTIVLDEDNEDDFGLVPGGYYEAAVFQAERHTCGSNYRLELGGFFFGRTECTSICGDGIVTRDELCDDGVNDGGPGECEPGCRSWAPTTASEGSYWRDYDGTLCNIGDGGETRVDWGDLNWSAELPVGTSIRLEIRAADAEDELPSAPPISFVTPVASSPVNVGDLLQAAGLSPHTPFVRVTSVLLAAPDGTSPALYSMGLEFSCTTTVTQRDTSDLVCAGDPVVCTTGDCNLEDSPAACTDGLDNDCDGDFDCADTDCEGLSCGSDGRVCSAGVCACGAGSTEDTLLTCQDGLDNDCDGDVDCDDDDCAGQCLRMETVVTRASGLVARVNLTQTYASPVVVCTGHYDASSQPFVPRVAGVTQTSFELWLQRPDGGTPAQETVYCLAVEEGVWDVDGLKLEAQRYTSTLTDYRNSWVGEAQSYGQAYTQPVVLGQVMSANDSDFSVFWTRGDSQSSPPNASALRTGKSVLEDSDQMRADETIGFIVLEAGRYTVDGVELEAGLGSDSVEGIGNSPPYTYALSPAFGATPHAALVCTAGVDGNDGSWALLYGGSALEASSIDLVVDEDTLGDSERRHTDEEVGYVVFGAPLQYGP